MFGGHFVIYANSESHYTPETNITLSILSQYDNKKSMWESEKYCIETLGSLLKALEQWKEGIEKEK